MDQRALKLYLGNVLGLQNILCQEGHSVVREPGAEDLWQEQARGADQGKVLFFYLKVSDASLFESASYQLLEKMIQAMGLQDDDWQALEITPNHVLEQKEHIRSYILGLGSSIIVAFGVEAYQLLLGKVTNHEGRGGWFFAEETRVIPTYAPFFLLDNPSSKGVVWKDLQKVMEELKKCQN